MKTTLGRSGLATSSLAFGTWQLSGHWGGFDEDAAVTAIRRARELGVTVFDTAHVYGWGQAERILGRALKKDLRENRDDLVIVTKGGLRLNEQGGPYPDSSREWLREGIENSLRSLDVDHIDVYLVHAPDKETPFEDTAEFLRGYVDDGTIGHVGVSNFDAEQTAEFAALLPVEVIEPRYNLFQRDIEDDLLPYAERNDLGVLTYSPLANGQLSGALSADSAFAKDDWRSYAPMFRGDPFRRTLRTVERLGALAREEFGVPVACLATAWALAHPAVDGVIFGTRRAGHVEQLVGARDLRLGPEELRAIDRVIASPDDLA